LGLNVVADIWHHDNYSEPRGMLTASARQLAGLPVLFVGVRCPIEVIMERRLATWGVGYDSDGSVPAPVSRFQRDIHLPGIYDLEVDTSKLSSQACADRIRHHLEAGPIPAAFQRLAA
jgi:chloramphenicol 3-O phosphotransferase